MTNGFLNRKKTAEGLSRSRTTWFNKLAGVFRKPTISEEDWKNAEEILLQADVGYRTTSFLLNGVRARLANDRRDGFNVLELLKEEICSILEFDNHLGSSLERPSGPKVIVVAGVNGVGKTTSIAKLASYYQTQGCTVLLGAADTFRAAAIEQLQIWGERIGVEVIAHQHGSDPSAVAFDTVQAAIARKVDVVIIDTAGRIHTKVNLMEELKKLIRVISRLDSDAPHEILLVLDSTIGQNGLAQASSFMEAISCSGIILTKLDGSAKGGVVLSVCRDLKLPIQFIGVGERAEDLIPFIPEDFVEALFTPMSGESPS